MQRFLNFFEKRKLGVAVSIPYEGKYFTVTKAELTFPDESVKGDFIYHDMPGFVAEGVARRSLDKHDKERAGQVSGGRAIKALYLKVNYHEEKKKLTDLLATADMRTEKNKTDANKIREQVRLLDKQYKGLVHGHVHLLMG